jgi:(p)ppGpp synthase/HD superfamily hydrolase
MNNVRPKFRTETGGDEYYAKCQAMKALAEKAEIYATKAHADTNHMYDQYLPYPFHLKMAVQVAYDFSWLFDELEFWTLVCALWLHDVIEDARKTYSDIKKKFNEEIAEIVRAVTNYTRGRNREERMPDYIYEEIASIFLATACKLCDRIANGQYSKMTRSSMFDKYGKEDGNFTKKLFTTSNLRLQPMFQYMNQLFAEPIISFI